MTPETVRRLQELAKQWKEHADSLLADVPEMERKALWVTSASITARAWACRDCANDLASLLTAVSATNHSLSDDIETLRGNILTMPDRAARVESIAVLNRLLTAVSALDRCFVL